MNSIVFNECENLTLYSMPPKLSNNENKAKVNAACRRKCVVFSLICYVETDPQAVETDPHIIKKALAITEKHFSKNYLRKMKNTSLVDSYKQRM